MYMYNLQGRLKSWEDKLSPEMKKLLIPSDPEDASNLAVDIDNGDIFFLVSCFLFLLLLLLLLLNLHHLIHTSKEIIILNIIPCVPNILSNRTFSTFSPLYNRRRDDKSRES